MRCAPALLFFAVACGVPSADVTSRTLTLAIEPDGVTEPWLLAPEVEGVVIDVFAPGRCLRRVSPPAPDASVAAGASRFVVVPHRELNFRVGLVDCETLLPVGAPNGGFLEATVRRFTVREVSVVPLRLHLDAGDDLTRELDDLLAPAGLTVAIETIARSPLQAASFFAGDVSELVPLANVGGDQAIDVVLSGCLRYADPIFGPPLVVDAYTPRIPGGVGPADAIYVRSTDCSTSDVRIALSPRVLAKRVAHELGHVLGLVHTVEANGITDNLEDTDEENLMHHDPGRVASVGFSASQRRIMRHHLAARLDSRALLNGACAGRQPKHSELRSRAYRERI